MGDSFLEESIKQLPSIKTIIRKVLIILIAAVALFFAIWQLGFIFIAIAIWIVCGLVWKHEIEFDYTFVNESIEIARIINQKRRRRVITFNCENIKVVAPKNAPRLEGYRKKSRLRKVDCSSHGKDAIVYSVIVEKESGSFEVLMELSEKALSIISSRTKGVVYQD